MSMTLDELAEQPSPSAAYQLAIDNGQFVYQRCTPCDRAVFPPRTMCPHCGGGLRWQQSSGDGTVYSSTALQHRDSPATNVVLVDLVEGFRMMSTVVGVPADEVPLGARLSLTAPGKNDVAWPAFEIVTPA